MKLTKVFETERPGKIKCNSCEWKGTENDVLIDKNEQEYCPNCKTPGCLMDK